MKLKKFTLLICFIILPVANFAQGFIVGAKFGVGSSMYKRQSDGLKITDNFTQRYALSLAFSPYFSKFLVVSGVEYETNHLTTDLMIPLGLRIAIGDKFKGFIEGGGYFTISVKSKSESYTSKNDIGGRAGIGLQYKINRNWIIELAYFGKFGFTPRLEEEIVIPGNQIQYEKYRLTSHQIELCVKHSF